jgi:thioredoxin
MIKIKNLVVAVVAFAAVSAGCSNGTAKTENSDSKTEKSAEAKSAKKEKKTIHLTNADFKTKVFNYEVNKEWKYEGDKPCIIDFYADWCGPCKRVAPILEELAEEYDGKIIIYKVNTEKERELASAFGIRSIPSLLFVPASGQPQMAQGALPKEQFVKVINEFLLKEEK